MIKQLLRLYEQLFPWCCKTDIIWILLNIIHLNNYFYYHFHVLVLLLRALLHFGAAWPPCYQRPYSLLYLYVLPRDLSSPFHSLSCMACSGMTINIRILTKSYKRKYLSPFSRVKGVAFNFCVLSSQQSRPWRHSVWSQIWQKKKRQQIFTFEELELKNVWQKQQEGPLCVGQVNWKLKGRIFHCFWFMIFPLVSSFSNPLFKYIKQSLAFISSLYTYHVEADIQTF